MNTTDPPATPGPDLTAEELAELRRFTGRCDRCRTVELQPSRLRALLAMAERAAAAEAELAAARDARLARTTEGLADGE